MTRKPLKVLLAGLFAVSCNSVAMEVVECNACDAQAQLNAVSQQQAGDVFVVDFVNQTMSKFVVSQAGKTEKVRPTLGDTNSINQKFDYRKATLRAVK